MPENVEEKRQNAQTLFEMGAMTPDEARESFGMEPLEMPGQTDIPYINFNKVPVGSFDSDPPDEGNLE